MDIDELRKLITAVAKTDRRTISKDDIDFWGAMAHEGGWTLPMAMRALIQFRATRPGEWLEPGHLSQIIREARRKAAASFVAPDIPDGISGRDYPPWYRTQLAAHIDRVLTAWSAGEPIPEPSAALEVARERRALTAGPDLGACPEHLREQFAHDMSRAGREPAEPAPPVQLPRRPAGDPHRRAAAYAEIANLAEHRARQVEAEGEGESA